MLLNETARAKINLTLRVLGRRGDGYHDIESLVAFADIADTLSLRPGEGLTLRANGPFAGAIGGCNLVLRASAMVIEQWPGARAGAFHLVKELPVAAGIGGGSADAAAALRLLERANRGVVSRAGLARIAAGLGADVPVCLQSRAAVIRGIGELVTPLDAFPPVAAVLVNPGVELPTGDVFAALKLADLPAGGVPPAELQAFESAEALAACVAATGNDLEAPATTLAPVIGQIKSAVAELPGCLVAGLSGSGATCFGLFASPGEAQAGAASLASRQPVWWVRPTMLS